MRYVALEENFSHKRFGTSKTTRIRQIVYMNLGQWKTT